MQWYISDNWQDVKYNLVSIELSNVWLFAYFIEVSMALWGEMLPAPALTEGVHGSEEMPQHCCLSGNVYFYKRKFTCKC